MIVWTCYECGGSYTELTGDTDERLCEKCLNGDEEDDAE